MQARFTTAVLLGFVLIGTAACGGSGSGKQATIDELEADLAAAEEAREEAEEEAAEAERKRLEEEAAREQAEEDARQAEQDARQAEQDAAEAKEDARQAEQDATEAEDDAAEAERLRQEEEAQRLAAERARREAEERRQAAEERLGQSDEERQSAGFGTSAGTLVVTPRRTATATEVAISTPDFGILTATDVSGFTGWLAPAVTTQSDGTNRDTVLVYTNIEAPGTVPFRDSTYNAGRRVFNAQDEFVAAYPIRGARTDVGGTGFPATSAPPQTFPLVDRGYDTQAQMDAATAACASDSTCEAAVTALGLRNKDNFPLRYSVDAITSATLGGAGGSFNCASSSPSTACTVQRRGTDQLFFAGPWAFRPTAADTAVTVADANFMWFGWWARERIATKEWSYAVGHGPVGSRVSSVSAVSGAATYNGRAIGRFAIDDPLDDEDVVGAFSATATLQADFDENSLSGDLTEFTGDVPTANQSGGDDVWTVHLRKGSISGGSARGTSAWSIGDVANTDNVDEGGTWSASFYSNLPADQRTGVVPHGVAGTFTAEHTGAADMIGAFGANR